ncbi:hypothetical protein CBS147353_10600 [Aspergillus niger]|nr:hypothetical protein CBS147353_10600 [Aspergillus niger]
MITFETAKKFEAAGDRVGFLGSLNPPPHIKKHIREMDYPESLLHLVYFLEFITEEDAYRMSPDMHKLPQSEVLPAIMRVLDKERIEELDMDEGKKRSTDPGQMRPHIWAWLISWTLTFLFKGLMNVLRLAPHPPKEPAVCRYEQFRCEGRCLYLRRAAVWF